MVYINGHIEFWDNLFIVTTVGPLIKYIHTDVTTYVWRSGDYEKN